MGKGGWRFGAGRAATHVKAEDCLRIEAGCFAKAGVFDLGRTGAWIWREVDTGKERGRIGYRGAAGAVTLDFTVNGHPVRQHIAELRTACNYGGHRAWFACPRCERRVGVLFLRGRAGFVCRHCGQVAYRSQSENEVDRLWRKQRKAEGILGGKSWTRPKGMHRTTHERLLETIMACEVRREAVIDAWVARNPMQ